MLKARRSRYVFICFRDELFLDVGSLLRGAARTDASVQMYACSILSEREYPIDETTLRLLASLPDSGWTPAIDIARRSRLDLSFLKELAEKGLLLTNSKKASLRRLRRKEENLSSCKWNPYAALYHFMSKWRDVRMDLSLPEGFQSVHDLGQLSEKSLESLVARNGPPPSHFHRLQKPRGVHELPLVEKSGALYDLLKKRKTTRSFDQSKPLKIKYLSAVLRYVFGCHGYAPLLKQKGIVALKKTSPSGGGLHPIEVYPMINNVSGIDSGLYHYRVETHSLELIEKLRSERASELSESFTTGQWFAASAQALFILSARFHRHSWKYQNHKKAYAVILMDAAHLSQTFYLVCAELGLGAFFTAAINNANIEERLGLDPSEEGVIGICGCGVPSLEDSALEPRFRKYIPRRTLV